MVAKYDKTYYVVQIDKILHLVAQMASLFEPHIIYVKYLIFLALSLLISSHTRFVATLASNLRPRQRLARLRAKKEAQESHRMLPGV
jgi:hypothetical protein